MTTPDASDYSIHLVETWDGLYAPIGMRRPSGDGPFPMVLLASGNGGGGTQWLRTAMADRGHIVDRLVAAGYSCAWTRYRTEVDSGYANGGRLERAMGSGGEVFSRSPLEYEDTIAIAEHVRAMDDVDSARVAFVGVSHGGEMLLKMAAEYSGFAVGVACEPAAHEFLGLGGAELRQIRAAADERGDAPLRPGDVEMVHRLIPRAVVDDRLAGLTTPVLVMGRQADDLNALFRATYEVLEGAGKDVEWTTYAHDLHGYIFPIRAGDGEYTLDPEQRAAIDEVLAYLDRHLRG
jgi:dienelactone hydrolase